MVDIKNDRWQQVGTKPNFLLFTMRCDKITTIFSRVTEVKCENIFIWSKNIKRIISLLKEYEKNFVFDGN